MTLTEILLVLTLLAIATLLALPGARHSLDAIAVRSARETAFGLATQTRATALARGGAQFILEPRAGTATVVDAAGAVVARAVFRDIRIEAGESSSRIVLGYDARGLGRMASRTIHFRRGAATAGLTFSSYGRVRRW
ncbi:MAG: hypothetical protein ACT4O1_11805 [Gemmatimonadota bacterium]